MKLLGRWSLASLMTLLVNVAYFGLLVVRGRDPDPATHAFFSTDPFATANPQRIRPIVLVLILGQLVGTAGMACITPRVTQGLSIAGVKGLPAALLMSSILASVRALLSAGLRGKDLVLALNRALRGVRPEPGVTRAAADGVAAEPLRNETLDRHPQPMGTGRSEAPGPASVLLPPGRRWRRGDGAGKGRGPDSRSPALGRHAL